jgi:UDP-N-acetylmuramate--alanine ligase
MTISSPYWVMARGLKANKRGGFNFVVSSNLGGIGFDSVEVSLQVPGKHNIRNALAVFAIANLLGLSRDDVAKALGKFTGTGRRFQLRGEAKGISIFDDYAHHPTEIKATLAGARARYPDRRIWAVWQPHTYSRTQTLFLEFAHAFKDADEVIVTEVYAAREPKQDFTSAEIVSAMSHMSTRYIETLPAVTSYLLRNLKSGDVVIVMSAGDADQISTDLVKAFQER